MSAKKKKAITISVVATLLIVAIGICIYIVITKYNTPNTVSNNEKNEENAKTEKSETNEEPVIDFKGTVIEYSPDKEKPNENDMEVARTMLETKLVNLGYAEATVSIHGDTKIRIEIPGEKLAASLEELATPGKLTFRNSNGEILMEGTKEYIKNASAQYEDSMGYYVQIEFTEKGREAFKKATSTVFGSQLFVYLDEEIMSAPMVNEVIDEYSCIISGDFSVEDSAWLADTINQGMLPFSLNTISASYTE